MKKPKQRRLWVWVILVNMGLGWSIFDTDSEKRLLSRPRMPNSRVRVRRVEVKP
mgnify:CR=1 FL=1